MTGTSNLKSGGLSCDLFSGLEAEVELVSGEKAKVPDPSQEVMTSIDAPGILKFLEVRNKVDFLESIRTKLRTTRCARGFFAAFLYKLYRKFETSADIVSIVIF